LAALDEAVAFAEETGERFWEPEIHRLRGELLLLRGEPHPAEASYCRALEVARQQGARALELRAATSVARFWKERGDKTRARALLAPLHRSFDQGHDTRDLCEAQALLETL
jgi:predicted ATPase